MAREKSKFRETAAEDENTIEYWQEYAALGDAEIERLKDRVKKLEASNAELEGHLRAVAKLDKTTPYTYGKAEECKDGFGNLPTSGKRWRTPWEYVEGLKLPEKLADGDTNA